MKSDKCKALLLAIGLWPATFSLVAQTGTIQGKILDAQTDESLIGVSVLVEGTGTGAATDFDGNFVIGGLATGTYTLNISYVGYQPHTQQGVQVADGQTTTLEIRLKPEDLQLEEVEVVAKANRESESMLLMDQKQMLFATQAVGAKEMSRKGTSTAEAAVAQVSGISKQEGVKNVFVRGLGDRYNATTLNGFPIPSEDPEYKNIALDFFRSDMIQHINVSKVFNAASNGDVGGAAININSKELFGDAAFGVEADGGLNSSVPGSNFIRQDGVNYWGASRSALPTEGSFDFPNSLDPRRVGVPMDHSYAVSGGKLFRLGEQANPLSVFAIASYNQDYAYTRESVRNSTSDGTVYQDQTGDKYDINTNQVVLANVDLKLDRRHELTYNFLLLHANNQYVGDYAGMHSERFQAADDYRGFSRRQQANDNLLMTHQLLTQWTLNDNWRLNAGASYNNIKGLEPDRRENYLTHRTGDEYNLTGSNRQKRFFSTLRENDVNLRVNARYRLVHDMDIDRSNLEFGYVGRLVDDRFEAREYNFSAYPGVYALDGLKLDDLYNAANYEAGRFTMTEGDLNTYHVSKNIHSGYAEATQQFGERFTANLGLRLDYVDMVVDYDVQHVAPGAESINRLYWLPSLNLRYDVNDKHTLRLGASKSYTLPQSKEIAPYQYVNISFTSQGNPNLKPSDNYNLDLKWDYYMSASELLSVTAFYKHIANPIGRVDQGNSAGLLTYENIAPRATVAGLEVELRKNLFNRTNAAGTRNNRLSLGVNASYIYTNVTLDIVNTDPRRSQLEGASPFLANADLSYTLMAGERNFTTSLVAAWFSDRIYTLGTRSYHDIMEEGLATLDFVASLELDSHWSLKLKAANLLNPSHRLTRRIDGMAEPLVLNEYKKGMDFSLGVSFNL